MVVSRHRTKYRVVYKCKGCGHFDQTQAKTQPNAPSKCSVCSSNETQKIRHETVSK